MGFSTHVTLVKMKPSVMNVAVLELPELRNCSIVMREKAAVKRIKMKGNDVSI